MPLISNLFTSTKVTDTVYLRITNRSSFELGCQRWIVCVCVCVCACVCVCVCVGFTPVMLSGLSKWKPMMWLLLILTCSGSEKRQDGYTDCWNRIPGRLWEGKRYKDAFGPPFVCVHVEFQLLWLLFCCSCNRMRWHTMGIAERGVMGSSRQQVQGTWPPLSHPTRINQ